MSRDFPTGPETLQQVEDIASEANLEKIQEVLPKMSQLSDNEISQCINYFQYQFNSLYDELDPDALGLLDLSNITEEEHTALGCKYGNIVLIYSNLQALIKEQQYRQDSQSITAAADRPDQNITSPQAGPVTRSRSQERT